MALYVSGMILITFFSVAMNILGSNIRSTNYFIYKIMSLISLSVISFFLFYISYNRNYLVGTDGFMYYMFFWFQHYELYFDPFINLIYDLSIGNNNFQLFTIITSTLFYIIMIYSMYKMKLDFWAALFYFYASYIYLMSFNIVRQSIAISLVFLAIVLYLTLSNRIKAIIYYVISIVLAMNFHFSAILMMPLIILKYVKITSKKILLGTIVISLFYFSTEFKDSISFIFEFFNYYSNKYEANNVVFFEVNKEKGILEFLPVLIQLVFLYFYVKITEKRFEFSFKENFISVYYFSYLILYGLAGIEAVDRFQFYFLPSIILFYSMMHYKLKNSKYMGYLLLVQIFWILYFLIRLFSNHHGVVPYIM